MVKSRSVGMAILWSFLTCGIYGIYWFIKLTDDSNIVSGEDGTSGGMALLWTLLTCGIYGWFWAYNLGKKLDIAAANNGKPSQNRSILFLILNFVGLGIVTYAIAQSEINEYAQA